MNTPARKHFERNIIGEAVARQFAPAEEAVVTEQTEGADIPLKGNPGPTTWSAHIDGTFVADQSKGDN